MSAGMETIFQYRKQMLVDALVESVRLDLEKSLDPSTRDLEPLRSCLHGTGIDLLGDKLRPFILRPLFNRTLRQLLHNYPSTSSPLDVQKCQLLHNHYPSTSSPLDVQKCQLLHNNYPSTSSPLDVQKCQLLHNNPSTSSALDVQKCQLLHNYPSTSSALDVQKCVMLLRHNIWGPAHDRGTIHKGKLAQPQMLWRQRWRQGVCDLLCGEIEASSGMLHQSVFMQNAIVEHVWVPAATTAGVPAAEVAQFAGILGFLRSLCAQRLNRATSAIDTLVKVAFSCRFQQSPWDRHASVKGSTSTGSSFLSCPAIPITESLSSFLHNFGSLFDQQPSNLRLFLHFRRDSQLPTQLPAQLPNKNSVGAGIALPEVGFLDVGVKKPNYDFTDRPLVLLAQLMREKLQIAFRTSAAAAAPSGIELGRIYTPQEDQVYVDLLHLLVDQPDTCPDNCNTTNEYTVPRLGSRAGLVAKPWVLPLTEWSFWNRHPTLFHAMCQWFGCPYRFDPTTPSSKAFRIHEEHISEITRAWPTIAPSLLGLKQHKKQVATPSDEEGATGAMWYAMASSWTGTLKPHLFINPCSITDLREATSSSTNPCTCVYCDIAKAGRARAFHQFALTLDNHLPRVLAHVTYQYITPLPSK